MGARRAGQKEAAVSGAPCLPFRLNTERFTQEESEARGHPRLGMWAGKAAVRGGRRAKGSCSARMPAWSHPAGVRGANAPRRVPSLTDEQTESLRTRGALLQRPPPAPLQRGQR